MSHDAEQDVGARIKALREAAGLSQSQLAEMAGTNQQTVQRIESGATTTSRSTPKLLQLLVNQELTSSASSDDLVRAYLTEVDKKRITEGYQFRARKSITKSPTKDVAAKGILSVYARTKLYFSFEVEPGLISITDQKSIEFDLSQYLPISDNMYGLYVPVSDMEPEFEPGDIIIVDIASPPIPNVSCVFYSTDAGSELATIKRLISSNKDTWTVKSWNPIEETVFDRAQWQKCVRIVGKLSRR